MNRRNRQHVMRRVRIHAPAYAWLVRRAARGFRAGYADPHSTVKKMPGASWRWGWLDWAPPNAEYEWTCATRQHSKLISFALLWSL
jgi:hypothetical protein